VYGRAKRAPKDGYIRCLVLHTYLSEDDCQIEKQTRMVQICHAGLKPFIVELCDSIEDLGVTSRGSGGFGSTGK
jgi:dUTPase